MEVSFTNNKSPGSFIILGLFETYSYRYLKHDKHDDVETNFDDITFVKEWIHLMQKSLL